MHQKVSTCCILRDWNTICLKVEDWFCVLYIAVTTRDRKRLKSALVHFTHAAPLICVLLLSNLSLNASWIAQLKVSRIYSLLWRIILSCAWQSVGPLHKVFNMRTPTETLKQSTATERVPQSSFLYEHLTYFSGFRKEQQWANKKRALFGYLWELGEETLFKWTSGQFCIIVAK